MGKGGDLPRIGDLDPYRLGATSSLFGSAGHYGVRDEYVARTAGGVDARLAEALRGTQLVVVVGPSKAGKTRTLFEAVRAHDPAARVVCPVTDVFSELTADPRICSSADTLVLWLDDLHLYLTGGSGALTPAVLAALTARPGRTLVVATLRSELRAQLRGAGEMRRETRMLLEQALLIDLASTSDDPAERAAAGRAYPELVLDDYGLAEVLAGAPELLARYDEARYNDALLYAVIATAIDWARIGHTSPIPETTLTDLAEQGIRATHPGVEVTGDGVRAAIAQACKPPPGAGRTSALRTYLDDGVRGYRAFDYLVAADDGQNRRIPRVIPDWFWHMATRNAHRRTLHAVAHTAGTRGKTSIAVAIFRRLAGTGDTHAMTSLGLTLLSHGESAEAEAWFRKAADTDDSDAMTGVGLALSQRGEVAEAEAWFRKAIGAGNTTAMAGIAVLCRERGEIVEAEAWFRKAADAGSATAMSGLGVLLEERGEIVEAETWYRKGADAGNTAAMSGLGVLLEERGEIVEAETWYRKGADAGDTAAMSGLGVLLEERGEIVEAETWYRKGADAGNTAALAGLALLLRGRGEVAEAEVWIRKLVEIRNTAAMNDHRVLLTGPGDTTEVETW
ncbi:hypothetical protein C5E46_30215 [Nocardia nova]|nr:hypothetical protein C5E46_30215 [Nocardia nova]